MRRPLCDLPLEHFIPKLPIHNINIPHQKSSKRPLDLSPGVALSPAKRRILNQEGFFSRSPKKPIVGPDSPARKLDFGLPKNHTSAGQTTPKSSTPSDFVSKTSRDDDVDYFSPHRSGPSQLPTMIPRELPPPPDRISSHYPGFDVYQDTHIPLLRATNSSPASASESETEGDPPKENMPPRRKARKAATAPTPTPSLLSPEMKKRVDTEKARSTPATPKKKAAAGGGGREPTLTPTPRRPGPAVMTPVEKHARRRMLEEVDEVGGDEDEEML